MSRSGIAASIFTLVSLTAGTWNVLANVSWAETPEPLALEQVPPETETLLAQFPPPATTIISGIRSIAVTGIGQASVPADQAVIQMYFYTIAPIEYDPSKPPEPLRTSDYQFIRNTLTDVGVPAGDVDFYVDPASSSSLRLQVKLAQPTTDRMSEIITAINDAVIRDARLSPSGSSVIYTVDECAAPEDEARREAIANAQARATALAAAAGVQAGQILTLSDYSTWNASYTSNCPSSEEATLSPFQYSGYPFDPTSPPQVSVTTQITATYAIED